MHRVGKNLPIQFLKASKHTDFAKRMATETVVRIVSANFELARRRAFGMWQTFTDAHRTREHAFKRHRLEQLAGLARILFLLQTNVERRSRYILTAWATEAKARTRAIHTFHAIRIQCAWRQAMARRLRHRLYCAHLAACQRHSAIHSQRLVRGFLARREFRRRQVAKQESMAALQIQRAYHNQVLYRAYRRQKQSRAGALLQRVYRGHRGRVIALGRRAALAQCATSYVVEQLLPTAGANACRRIVSAHCIQRCVRHATARSNYTCAYPKLHARRRYFPTFRIQRTWHVFRSTQLATVVRRLVQGLWAVQGRLSCKFAYRDARRVERAQRRAAIAIQRMCRGHLARRRVQPLIDARLNALVQSLPPGFVVSPTILRGRGTQAMAQLEQQVQKWRGRNAVTLQRVYRGHVGRHVAKRVRIAWCHLLSVLNCPVHAFLRRQLGRRVRARWARKRHARFNKAFLAWKGIARALQHVHLLRSSARLRQLANWHFEKVLRKKTLRRWQIGLVRQREMRFKKRVAQSHASLSRQTKAFQRLYDHGLAAIVHERVSMLQYKVMFVRAWRLHTIQMRHIRAMEARYHARLSTAMLDQWRTVYIWDHLVQGLARRQREASSQRSHLRALLTYVARQQAVAAQWRRRGQQRGLSKWVTARAWTLLTNDQVARAHRFRARHIVRRWRQLRSVQETAMALRTKVHAFATVHGQRRALVNWLVYTDEARAYHVLYTKAQSLFKRTHVAKAFAEWFQLWAETAGERRIYFAKLVQRLWRGKLSRRRFTQARALEDYKVARRIELGTDIPQLEPDAIQALVTPALRSKEWVLLLAYLPWTAPSPRMYNAFATVATSYYKNKRIAFGCVDATQRDASKSIASKYQLEDAMLPRLLVFWQGRGPDTPAQRDPARRITRRFTAVQLHYPHPLLQTQELHAWVRRLLSTSRECTAIDLQADWRRFLVRLRRYYRRQICRRDAIVRVVLWFVQRRRARRRRNATKLQRWYRRRKEQIAAYARVVASMAAYRRPIVAFQRTLRRHYCRRQFRRAMDEKHATVDKYPHAPLCLTCECAVGVLKCIDCNEPYCDACFGVYHSSGHRASHRSKLIDFIAMHANDPMCADCLVDRPQRVCKSCKKGLCGQCHNKTHTIASGAQTHVYTRARVLLKTFERAHKTTAKTSAVMHRKLEKKRATLLLTETAHEIMLSQHWMSFTQREAARVATEAATKKEADRAAALAYAMAQLEQPVLDAFEIYDPDHGGYVGAGELAMLLRNELCIPLTKKQLAMGMRAIDQDGNGRFEWREICAWLAEIAVDHKLDGRLDALRRKKLHVQKDYRNLQRKIRKWKTSVFPARKKRIRTVPGFPDVPQLHPLDDFQSKKAVFYRFLSAEFGMKWILQDVHEIDLANQMAVFASTFVLRWNRGQLNFEYYYDGVTFEHDNTIWKQVWQETDRKYTFTNVADGSEHFADPRKVEMLFAQAREAFGEVDTDGSGQIDVLELYHLLNHNLCEPVTMDQARTIMESIDKDASGAIDFNEFYTWYASENSQQCPKSMQHRGLRTALRTRRHAKRIVTTSYKKGLATSKSVVQSVQNRIEAQRLAKACEGADPEMVELLIEGFDKPMVHKALMLAQNDVNKARTWLRQRKEEAELDAKQRKEARQKRRNAQLRGLHAAHSTAKEGLVGIAKAIKLLIFGDKPNHDDEVAMILRDLQLDVNRAEGIVRDTIENS
ncbi:hypothetical protein, variant [Saprolegnia diclina VS20]|nr:hypothetical protein, variant [Saprolegnia diclina VS20]EQC28114.1 hypothetical protein, variant [Saprolegnia diclina VS20]|eukprot:XP_008618539.1 hypothetical protein, variant [Saprolegnia diclina VS20]